MADPICPTHGAGFGTPCYLCVDADNRVLRARVAKLQRKRDEASLDVRGMADIRKAMGMRDAAHGLDVSIMVAHRIATLERERDLAVSEHELACQCYDDDAARIATLEAALREYLRAGIGESTSFEVQMSAYRMAAAALR